MRLLTRERSAAPIRPALGPRAARAISAAGPEAAAGEVPRERLPGRRDEELAGVAQSAADHELPGIQGRGKVCQSQAEPLPDVLDELAGGRVAGFGQLRHGHARDPAYVSVHGPQQLLGYRGIGGGELPCLAAKRIAGGVLLPAAPVAALAAVAAGHDDLVPELPRHAKAAAFHAPVHHHGAADPGAQGDADQPALTLPGAEAPFRPGGGIGVVGQQNGAAQQALQVLPQWFIAPGEVRTEEHRARRPDPSSRRRRCPRTRSGARHPVLRPVRR